MPVIDDISDVKFTYKEIAYMSVAVWHDLESARDVLANQDKVELSDIDQFRKGVEDLRMLHARLEAYMMRHAVVFGISKE